MCVCVGVILYIPLVEAEVGQEVIDGEEGQV